MQKPIIGDDSVDVSFRSRSRNADGGLNFEILPIYKKGANCLDEPGAYLEISLYLRWSIIIQFFFLNMYLLCGLEERSYRMGRCLLYRTTGSRFLCICCRLFEVFARPGCVCRGLRLNQSVELRRNHYKFESVLTGIPGYHRYLNKCCVSGVEVSVSP